jgi:hypothetical protein
MVRLSWMDIRSNVRGRAGEAAELRGRMINEASRIRKEGCRGAHAHPNWALSGHLIPVCSAASGRQRPPPAKAANSSA